LSWERGKVPQAVKGIGLFLLTLGLQNLIGPFAEIGLAEEGALGKRGGNPSKIHRKIGPRSVEPTYHFFWPPCLRLSLAG